VFSAQLKIRQPHAYKGYNVTFTTGNPSAPRHIYVRDILGPGVGATISIGSFVSNVYFPNLWLQLPDVIACRTLTLGECLQTKGRSREQVLRAFGQGFIDEATLTGKFVNTWRLRELLAKAEGHAERAESDLQTALATAGARYGPANRADFIRDLRIRRFEPAFGKFKSSKCVSPGVFQRSLGARLQNLLGA
jgi:hypothetical protein